MILCNFYCLNSECEWTQIIKIDLPDDEIDKEYCCENCGSVLKFVGTSSKVYTTKFNQLSPNEKKNILKKRSSDHNKKFKGMYEQKNRPDFMP